MNVIDLSHELGAEQYQLVLLLADMGLLRLDWTTELYNVVVPEERLDEVRERWFAATKALVEQAMGIGATAGSEED